MSSVLKTVLNYQQQNTDFIALEQASIERDMEELKRQNATLESLYALSDSIQSLSASNEDFGHLTSKVSLEGIMDSIVEHVKKFKDFVIKIITKIYDFIKSILNKLISLFKKKNEEENKDRNEATVKKTIEIHGNESLGIVLFLINKPIEDVRKDYIFSESDAQRLVPGFIDTINKTKHIYHDSLNKIGSLLKDIEPANLNEILSGEWVKKIAEHFRVNNEMVFELPLGKSILRLKENKYYDRFDVVFEFLNYKGDVFDGFSQTKAFRKYLSEPQNVQLPAIQHNTNSINSAVRDFEHIFDKEACLKLFNEHGVIKYEEEFDNTIQGIEDNSLRSDVIFAFRKATRIERRLLDFFARYLHCLGIFVSDISVDLSMIIDRSSKTINQSMKKDKPS